MGELILCQGRIAAMPYFIESASLNIYSLEELCYYLDTYPDCLEEAFFSQELSAWMKRELGLPDLADKLEELRQANGNVADLAEVILRACGYLTEEACNALLAQYRELDGKDEFARGKMGADRSLKNHRFAQSILAYRRLLRDATEAGALAVDVGNIWHNMGVACANMFLYEQAAECFEKAYEYNNKPESMLEMYLAKQCISGKERTGEDELPKEWQDPVMERMQQATDGAEEVLNEAVTEDMLEIWKKKYRLYSQL